MNAGGLLAMHGLGRLRGVSWAAIPIVVGACGLAAAPCEFDATCTKGPTRDMRDPTGPTPPGALPSTPSCDAHDWPTNADCILGSDGGGTFVSTSDGRDDAAGTQAAPLKTIDAAIRRKAKRIYLCEGLYEAGVSISESTDGVELRGGLSCDGGVWVYTGSRPRVRPKEGPALRVEKLKVGMVAEDIEFEALDAQKVGGSSIAVWVEGSIGVVFRRVGIKAGAARDGASGADSIGSWPLTDDGRRGNGAIGKTGGEARTCECTWGGQSTGGHGGNGAVDKGVAGADGEVAVIGAQPWEGAGGEGGARSGALDGGRPVTCTPGFAGACAAAPSPPIAGAPRMVFTLTSIQWTPGRDGAPGMTGQGGGGGGGSVGVAPAGGGGGGCGGCGGGGGQAGQGGGSSVALASIASDIVIEHSALTASAAGRGGKGGSGQSGQAGAAGGGSSGAGCGGGEGGAGAGGNGGDGGGGGASLGVAFSAKGPKIDGVQIVGAKTVGGVNVGPSGPGGRGGAAGEAGQNATNWGYAGSDGEPGIGAAATEIAAASRPVE